MSFVTVLQQRRSSGVAIEVPCQFRRVEGERGDVGLWRGAVPLSSWRYAPLREIRDIVDASNTGWHCLQKDGGGGVGDARANGKDGDFGDELDNTQGRVVRYLAMLL